MTEISPSSCLLVGSGFLFPFSLLCSSGWFSPCPGFVWGLPEMWEPGCALHRRLFSRNAPDSLLGWFPCLLPSGRVACVLRWVFLAGRNGGPQQESPLKSPRLRPGGSTAFLSVRVSETQIFPLAPPGLTLSTWPPPAFSTWIGAPHGSLSVSGPRRFSGIS